MLLISKFFPFSYAEAPNLKLSSTESLEKILLPSGTCEIPRFTISCGDKFSMCWSSNKISPVEALLTPLIVINKVDLPAPLEPIKC